MVKPFAVAASTVGSEIADRICFLHQGRILESGPPARLFGEPQEERTRQFLQRVTDAGRM